MDMNAPRFQLNYSKYGMFLGTFGLVSSLLMFPSGIYIGFFCGFVGLVCLVIGKRTQGRMRGQTLGLVFCVLSLLASLLFFASLLSFYTALNDPQYGPRFTKIMLQLLEQNGIPLDEFTRLMAI